MPGHIVYALTKQLSYASYAFFKVLCTIYLWLLRSAQLGGFTNGFLWYLIGFSTYYRPDDAFMMKQVAISEDKSSLVRPHPFHAATYRLEIISAALQGSGIVHVFYNP